jgi:DNA-binding transcriptional MerR regulator
MTDEVTSGEMTIDELAREAGLVVSTVRLYQNRGLIPGPVKRGRVGWYSPSHLARLRLIGDLQERGFSLAAIRELVDGMVEGQSLASVLGLDRTGTPAAAVPQTLTMAELMAELPGVTFTPELVQRVVGLGLIEVSPDLATVTVRSPTFLRVGRELVRLGVPTDEILDQYEQLQVDARVVAARFSQLFREHLWEGDGDPLTRLGELGGLAQEVVGMALQLALAEEAERFAREEAARFGVPIEEPPVSG